jgi:pyruvate carboxylase
MREALPNIAIQMLLRGRNTVGYTPYPIAVTDAFIAEAVDTGIDIFRIFDALNSIDQMRPAIDAVRADGRALAEVGLCFSGNLLDPSEDLYTLDYYLRLADEAVSAGAHILAIKDMAGLLRAEAAEKLVTALRSEFDTPVHLHTHDTAGGQLATLLAASRAGVDAVDAASAPLSGTTSQPSLSALVAALEFTERDTGLSLGNVSALEPYFEAVRAVYRPFESGLPGPTGRVYHHEIPGGQLSNLRQQAIALGLGDRFEAIEDWYAHVNRILGRPTKVTPSSKVVGDLALQLAAGDVDPADFEAHPENYDVPDSVIGFLAGELGTPPGGWPEPFRTRLMAGRERRASTPELSEETRVALTLAGRARQELLNELLFPGPTKDFTELRAHYGDLSVLDTKDYLYGLTVGEETTIEVEPGVRLYVELEAISDVDDRGMRTVLIGLNGQMRPLTVPDRSVTVDIPTVEKADVERLDHVAAPFAGVVSLKVAAGDTVAAGDVVATIEAMKMEAAITATRSGTIERLAIVSPHSVEAGDLLVVIS